MKWDPDEHPRDENNQMFVKKGTRLGVKKENLTQTQRHYFWTVIANGKYVPLREDGTIDYEAYEVIYDSLPYQRKALNMTLRDFSEWNKQLGLVQSGNAPRISTTEGLCISISRKYVITAGTFDTPRIVRVISKNDTNAIKELRRQIQNGTK